MPPKAYAFDAYGTLFNVAGAALRYRETLGVDAEAFAAHWRLKQIEYTWNLTLMGRYTDFWELTQRALDYTFEKFPLADRKLRQDLLDSYWKLDAYADTKPALEKLRANGSRAVIFTNGTPAMAKGAAESAGVSHLIEGIVSIDAIRKFKTTPDAYKHVCETLGLPHSDVALVSSNRWDVAGAISSGMRAIWCNRTGQPEEYPGLTAERTIKGLNEL